MDPTDRMVLAGNLRQHVSQLAGTIGERHMWRVGSLDRAADYIEEAFRKAGCEPVRQSFQAYGRQVCNLVVEKAGCSEEVVVVGAHYDSVPGSPGADDNASAVAGLIELARLLRNGAGRVGFRLVAFANEESPAFGTEYMGSLRYARHLKESDTRTAGMVCLEMIGSYDPLRLQDYPLRLMRFFFPKRADFIGVVSNPASYGFARRLVRGMRRSRAVRVATLVAPLSLGGTDRSDHSAFWRNGFKAVMVTDTAQYRNPHYHRETDTPATLDYTWMARVVLALYGALVEL